MNVPKRIYGLEWPDIAAILLLIVFFVGYLYNITGWLIFDDEGEYLYQIWRMTSGELPYKDFLTPQLPVFLFSGSAVMNLSGPNLLVMRLFSVVLAFSTAIMLFIAARRHNNSLAGLITMALFLIHPDVFRETRIFRNEPIFLFLVTSGLIIATWDRNRPSLRNLAISGFFLGLATMVKLFGLLPVGGIGLWLIWDWWREKRSLREFLSEVAAFIVPLVVVLLLLVLVFSLVSPNFLNLVLGHHLDQGSGQSLISILGDKLGLFGRYFALYPLFVGLAIVSAVAGFIQNDARQRWAWQLVTAFSFLILSRLLGQRHFMYLVPVMSFLAGWLLANGLNGQYRWWGRVGAAVAIIVVIAPWLQLNADRASWSDTQTQSVIDFIQANTEEFDSILSDDIGLAYYAQRPTTYSGAALSHGAVTSGQITGERLIDEIVKDNTRLVIVDQSLLTGNHLVFLRDYPRFHRFLEQNFQLVDVVRRDFQELALWSRDGGAEWVTNDIIEVENQDGSEFGEYIRLLGYAVEEDELSPGNRLELTLYWEAEGSAERYWSVFVHLVDRNGELVGQHDKVSYDGLYPPNRWWPGQIIDDRFAIEIPVDAAEGEYSVRIGMYDHLTGERLQLTDRFGQPALDNQIELAKMLQIKVP